MIEVIDPIAPLAFGEARLARRNKPLAGATLGIFTTEGPNGRELIEAIAKLLVERDGVRSVLHRSRQGGGDYDQIAGARVAAAHEPPARVAERIDLAIAGVGL